MDPGAYDETIAAVTLAGSAVSALATACVLVWFAIYNEHQRSLRHALVLSLTISDFINSSTNTVSGSFYMRDHALYASAGCTFNGWIEQLSVQATDFSILAISVSTLFVILRKGRLGQVSTLKKVVICASAWVVPFITSTTVTAMGEIQPVSGSWCWISKDRTDLRYGMTHAWRIAIIFSTVGIYTYVWWHVSRHFRSLRKLHGGARPSSFRNSQDLEHVGSDNSPASPAKDDEVTSSPGSHAVQSQNTNSIEEQGDVENPPNTYMQNQAREAERAVKRMLLMNGYPIMYVLLWIPGLINRFLEASGSSTSNHVVAILQCSTQFIGFANAVTYGFSGIWKKDK